jgi:hypothetical protein
VEESLIRLGNIIAEGEKPIESFFEDGFSVIFYYYDYSADTVENIIKILILSNAKMNVLINESKSLANSAGEMQNFKGCY